MLGKEKTHFDLLATLLPLNPIPIWIPKRLDIESLTKRRLSVMRSLFYNGKLNLFPFEGEKMEWLLFLIPVDS